MKEAVIVSAVRTPMGKFGGSLKQLTASELGKTVIKSIFNDIGFRPSVSEGARAWRPKATKEIEKSPIEAEKMDWGDEEGIFIDEVIMGNVLQGGQGQNPARQASIKAGMPKETPAYTVNKVCGSGMKSVGIAAEKIRSGTADAIIAGGMESMSRAPYVLPKARWGYRMDVDGGGEMRDMMVRDGLYEIFYGYHMGKTAENLVDMYDISREEQDRLSVESQNRAVEAVKKGIFEDEIVPIEVEERKGTITFDEDETPRKTDMQKMKNLPPVFKEDGTVTAGNSSSITDGAAALFVTSKKFAEEHGLDIISRIEEQASAGVDPQYMGLGPVAATNKLLSRTDYEKEDIDLIEENEAFAGQVLACMEEMHTPKYGVGGLSEEGSENMNPHGSGISLGHPIGCSGARILVTLAHEMKRRSDHRGLATLCIGGGMGMAMTIKR